MTSASRSPLSSATITGVGWSLFLALLCVTGLMFGQTAAHIDTANTLAPPSAQHWLGSDELGRDLLARVIAAAPLSIGASLAATLAGAFCGTAIGLLIAAAGRRTARLASAAVNLGLAFPLLLLALFVAAVMGPGLHSAIAAIAFAIVPTFARLTHKLAINVSAADFVAAARLLGASPLRIALHHIAPNIAGPLLITAVMVASGVLIVFSGLSFLGLGVQPPLFDWGGLLSRGLQRIYVNPIPALAPAAMIVACGVAFSFIGEALAVALGVRTPSARRAAGARQPAASAAEHNDGMVLSVQNLSVFACGQRGPMRIVDGFDLAIAPGERIGIVGESGSGKTLAMLAMSGLLDGSLRASADRATFLGQDVRTPSRDMQRALGQYQAFVFQNPLDAFHPMQRLGRQLSETMTAHAGASHKETQARALDRLQRVRIAEPHQRLRQYPHQLSGGMLQRCMIAMGLMTAPKLIIADEPTTALDVTVQKQVLALLEEVCAETGAALVLVSHDLAVVAQTCTRVLVMYAGRIVEELPADQLSAPAHPYTQALVAAVIDLDTARGAPLTTLPGSAPAAGDFGEGCSFSARCAVADEKCRSKLPPAVSPAPGHRVACWRMVDAA